MEIVHEGLKTNIPNFKPGDTLRLSLRVTEGDSERIQLFDGVVIARRGHGIAETFTIRKISFGVGVERIFPIHSPKIEKMEVIKNGKVRRAKLFYLRDLAGKAARLQEHKADEAAAATNEAAPAAAAPAAAEQPAEKKA